MKGWRATLTLRAAKDAAWTMEKIAALRMRSTSNTFGGRL